MQPVSPFTPLCRVRANPPPVVSGFLALVIGILGAVAFVGWVDDAPQEGPLVTSEQREALARDFAVECGPSAAEREAGQLAQFAAQSPAVRDGANAKSRH